MYVQLKSKFHKLIQSIFCCCWDETNNEPKSGFLSVHALSTLLETLY